MPAKKKAKRAPRTVNKEAKRCGLCPAGEQMHPIEDFYLTSNPIYSDGRLPVCKVCMAKTLLGEDYNCKPNHLLSYCGRWMHRGSLR